MGQARIFSLTELAHGTVFKLERQQNQARKTKERREE
jgi:hypothetical protein